MIKLRIAALALLVIVTANACKKNAPDLPAPPTGTRLQLSLDSLFFYAKETYLWYDELPDYNTFNPRGYASSDELESLTAALFKLTQYPIYNTTGLPYEYRDGSSSKYSYVDNGNLAQGIKGSINLEGEGEDMGFGVSIVNGTYVFISFVEKGSPADLAGIHRGDRIVTMNGGPVSTNSTTLINAINANSAQMTLQRGGLLGNIYSANLTKTSYTNNPVYKDTIIINDGVNRTGYLALARFSRLSNVQSTLDAVFKRFTDAGVNNLVIDLRYNGGGYVQTFEYLANLMAPSVLNGSVMYKEIFNDLMREGRAPILKSIPYLDENGKQKYNNNKPVTYADLDFSESGNTFEFNKIGTLGAVKKIAFIVSEYTASASELTINSMKPYFGTNLKLVGPAGKRTYGKPVGFFGIGIDKFTVYMSQFASKNANGDGAYYNGMAIDIAAVDDATHNFGDPDEDSFQKALGFITGSPRQSADNARSAQISVQHIDNERFIGMIEERRHLKK